ncbi:MAG: hypothetical protein QNL62_06520 [Gammaproteobacteria bacterium]|nr:hypothetical protein [Gammaproteobacteria bacterium]
MFHYTKLDMFCSDVKKYADSDGYVPEATDIIQDFSYPDKQFKNLQTWSQHIQDSVHATRSAQQKLVAWRNRL